jgi:hypothetical protein
MDKLDNKRGSNRRSPECLHPLDKFEMSLVACTLAAGRLSHKEDTQGLIICGMPVLQVLIAGDADPPVCRIMDYT